MNTNTNPGINPKPRSKIARLPKAIRDQLNDMLEEGASYKQILKWLASIGHPNFNDNNLYHWRRGAYQDWRLERERKHEADALRKWSATIALDRDPTLVATALTNFTAARLHRLLGSIDLSALVTDLQSHPEVCVRYFNSALRTGRIALEAARVHHASRQQQAPRSPRRAPIGFEMADAAGKMAAFGPESKEAGLASLPPVSNPDGSLP